jgi:hypothetical protein
MPILDDMPNPKKVAPSKVAEYIRLCYIEGMTRAQSYIQAVNPDALKLEVRTRYNHINALEARDDFQALKDMVMEEDTQDLLRRSSTAQRKALSLLMDTLDAAQQAVRENPTDPKTLASASSILKGLGSAFQATQATENDSERMLEARRARAAKVIAG